MSGEEPNKSGPSELVVIYGGLTALAAGIFLPSIIRHPNSENLRMLFLVIAGNYIVNKISDSAWHNKYPEDNPKGAVFREACRAQGIIAGIGAILGSPGFFKD